MALCSSRPVTSGTSTAVGPFDTDSVILAPFDDTELAQRVLRDDDALLLVRVDVLARDREARALQRRCSASS